MRMYTVSYTHLDVYKRQEKKSHQDEMGGSSMELRAFQLETSLMVAEKTLNVCNLL